MKSTFFRALAAGCAIAAIAVGIASAQQTAQKPATPPAPAATNQDIEALKRQIQALIAGQIAMQRQLDEIKTLLSRPAPVAAAPAAAPPAVSTIDTMIDIAGAHVKGSASAKVAVLEFSDYQCPFCGRAAAETLPELTREYIDTGKIKYFFKNLPLESIHPNALRAAVAAECAGEQDKYWPMHDRLFAGQTTLDPVSLVNYGRAAGVDVTRFQQCVNNSEKPLARIRQEQAEGGRVGATSTPTFFVAVINAGDSKVRAVRIIRGAQPYPTFKAAIDSVLASIK